MRHTPAPAPRAPSALLAASALLSPLLWPLLSCAAAPAPLLWDAVPGPYVDALRDWTRAAERFEELEGRLFVSATLLSPTFERARAAELAARLDLTADERRREEEALARRAAEQRLFFVALATQEHVHNDLRPRGGPFAAHLLVGEEALPASWVTEVATQEQVALQRLFPALTSLHRGYWVSFPAAPASAAPRLRVSGLPGAVTLSWELGADGGAPRGALEGGAP